MPGSIGGAVADRLTDAGVVALTLIGWAVLAYVVVLLPVSAGSQAVLYAAGFVALSGSVALVYELYLARARGRGPARPATALLGTGMRFAVIAEFALWLQSLRLLTPGYAVLLAAAFIFLEFLARQAGDSERGQRRG